MLSTKVTQREEATRAKKDSWVTAKVRRPKLPKFPQREHHTGEFWHIYIYHVLKRFLHKATKIERLRKYSQKEKEHTRAPGLEGGL